MAQSGVRGTHSSYRKEELYAIVRHKTNAKWGRNRKDKTFLMTSIFVNHMLQTCKKEEEKDQRNHLMQPKTTALQIFPTTEHSKAT